MNPFEAATAFWAALLPKAVVPEAEEVARLGEAMATLLESATAMMAQMASQMPGSDANTAALFRKIADPAAWLSGGADLHEALDQIAHGPRFADMWDIERRYARLSAAVLEMRRVSDLHHAVVLAAWMEAAAEFSGVIAVNPPADGRAMMAQWSEIANRVLITAQRSDAFLASQAATLRAGVELSLAQQDLGELFGRLYGFPTRTEVDDLHRTVTELRRELRALKRELAESQPQKQHA